MPNLVSYNRFVELMSYALLALCCYFEYGCKGDVTGTSFIDSTALKVCHKNRANSHKVFAGIAEGSDIMSLRLPIISSRDTA
nr:transposase [Microseira wollei]